jgi:two-component system, OmpR family, alkaline phosphatase synthesis response regulator PhoP
MVKSGERRVLVVHDEPEFTAGLKKVLGGDVDVAVDGRAAIACIARNRPAVVCVSLNLPRDSGYDLCEQIRKDRALDQVQILVISDRHSPEIIAYAEEAGANAFLARPFTFELLAKYVRNMLAADGRSRSGSIRRRLDEGLALE